MLDLSILFKDVNRKKNGIFLQNDRAAAGQKEGYSSRKQGLGGGPNGGQGGTMDQINRTEVVLRYFSSRRETMRRTMLRRRSSSWGVFGS